MPPFRRDRRSFLVLTSEALGATVLRAQTASLAHASVSDLERSRVLARASAALSAPVAPVTATVPPRATPNRFFSETQPDPKSADSSAVPSLFRAQARALRDFSDTTACLAAAYLLTSKNQYAARAADHLRASLLTPATRMKPVFDTAGCAPGTATGTPAGVTDLVPLAELGRTLSFLVDSQALTDAEWDGIAEWCGGAENWLATARTAVIARDTKDHRASAWLLIVSSLARFNRNESVLEGCRKRFRAPTLRNQIRSDGAFPQEVATPNPFRNTLFNFDLLTGACQLLSSPFDQLWTYELIDGVGLRIVAAYLYPLMAHPERWEYPADAIGFLDLPHRRPGLLFAGRAYDRPEYVELWRALPDGPPPPVLAASMPIRQPLLWTTRPPHGR